MTPGAPFVFVTGNTNKVREAERLLGHRPAHERLDLPEIQSLDLVEVCRVKAREAARRLGEARPVVVDETGLALSALAGFPGPLVKWMLAAVGPEGIARVAHRLGDPRATAQCLLIYLDGEREVVARGDVAGRLVEPPRGDAGFGWDPIFVPDGSERTFAEMSPEEKDALGHRGIAWRRLRRKLAGRV